MISFELGIPIAEKDKELWSKDVQAYYKHKCADLEKSKKCHELKERISVLEDKIVEANGNINSVSQDRANKLVENKMKNKNMTREKAFGRFYEEMYKEERVKFRSYCGKDR